MEWWWLSAASALAGFVDAIVGGGGLILVPALFAAYPTAAPATLLGTNKSASMWGTAAASWRYARRVRLPWHALLPAVGVCWLGAMAGAWAVTWVPGEPLRRALPWVLLALLLYTLARKDLGRQHAPRWAAGAETLAACVVAGVIGFYDGLFGPGTGSFFVFAFVRVLGYDFLHASAAAKLLNLTSNVAAVGLFAWKGHVWWALGLTMALANVAGSLLGTRLALRHGAGFVRGVFLLVVAALIAKTGWDAYAPLWR
ncbi:MAG: TSUP family transporter [Tepidimonas sp.]|uniref:TSUP family transporter n=1 Tax=Tepidimonas sp. TaxID=2002775 RepID=UPI00298EE385|nr:TSUP family transporter [Tepidimonas sp.]MCS6810715.1 TSUP family transporter [Tepidimonas sp.]MDW8335722.1 TSUP family transporter [Tepidimonas sp.]